MDVLTIPVECRSAAEGPKLHGTILQEGRAATGGRAELFAPGSIVWPSDGIALLAEHRGVELARAVPSREPDGEIRIETAATPEIFAAVEQGGKRHLSIEFRSVREIRTAAGIREITRAIVDAAALTDRPEYIQARAEVRQRRGGRRLWL